MNAGITKIGHYVDSYYLSSAENLVYYFSDRSNLELRVILALIDYLTINYSKTFGDVKLYLTSEMSSILGNGTWTGLIRYVNLSTIDIGGNKIMMDKNTLQAVDFSYPFKIEYRTFMIQQPEYDPQIFDILKTFSTSIWATLILMLIAMSLIYYFALKSKYPINEIILHLFGVTLRQSSIITPSTPSESLLIYSWVLGCMFICLAYDSVFLSFLAFPPIRPIKDLSGLAKAVKSGEYHCFIHPVDSGILQLKSSDNEYLKIIAHDILFQRISYYHYYDDFILERKKLNLAYLAYVSDLEYINVGKKFVSEDYVTETMFGLAVRKDFCCKKILETFVHRMVDSGLYYKCENDRAFLYRLEKLRKISQEETSSNRKLSLTNVAPAFIFLLTGYILACLVFAWEILSDRRRKKKGK